MRRFFFLCLFAFLLSAGFSFAQNTDSPPAPEEPETTPAAPTTPKNAYVVRLEGAIGAPSEYILKRALKEAIAEGIDIFVLDLDTRGGASDSMEKIMEALAAFPGKTVTYINKQAGSAGSFIAIVTDEIWFAPQAIMGAADVVKSDGSDIGETMKLKLHSFIDAKVRALAGDKGEYRHAVQRAMMDANFELKIDDIVIKPKGELLSLTAEEAVKTYGENDTPLLAAGIAKTTDEVLHAITGGAQITVKHFEKNWSEHAAQFLQWASPFLLAIAGMCVLIEYKTPGFGVFGITAAALFLIVFAGNYVAGLAGCEPLILLLLGVVLIVVEMIFFPGTYIALTLGIVSLVAGLAWSSADIWPHKGFSFSPEMLLAPLLQFGLATVIFLTLVVLLWRFLPEKVLKNRVILEAVVETEKLSPAHGADVGFAGKTGDKKLPAIGDSGIAITDLRLAGIVEIAGARFSAVSPAGMIDRGKRITVFGVRGDALEVEEA